jgi:hypothetical protein
MEICVDTICGIALGVEYIQEIEDVPNTIILDLFILRFLIQW